MNVLRFKVDENLPTETVDLLADAGYEAHTVFDEDLGGSPDPRISQVCREETRTLVTLDTDFADIRTDPPEQYAGILVLRLHRQDKPTVLATLRKVVRLLGDHSPRGRLWIIHENRIRIR